MAFLSWSASLKFKEDGVSVAVPTGDWVSQGTCQQMTENPHVWSSAHR